MAYDPRTGKKLKSGTTQDFSNAKFIPKFDTNTGKALTTSPVINSSSLAPAKPFNVTQPKPATSGIGLGAMVETGADDYTKNLAAKAKTSESGKTASLNSYLENLMNSKGETELTADAYSTEVDPLQKDLDEINSQINAEVMANRRRIEAIRKNSKGLFGGAVEQEATRVNDESVARQADLSVIQMARQGRYDSAKTIADRAVQVKLEKQKNLNEALRINYEDNKSLFDKDEQRSFEAAQSDRERKLDNEEKQLQEISDLSIDALTNGASTATVSNMRKAKTVEEAIRIGGQYVGALDRAIKNKELEKLALDIKKTKQEMIVPTVAGSPTDTLSKIINSAKNEKDLDASEREKLSKMKLVLSQLGTLQDSISKSNNTGIIKGRVNSLLGNLGLNKDAAVINAQLQALIPNVARGVYGEVGVLTNADIENYKKTLPNIKSKQDQNDLVLALSLKNALLSYENTLTTASQSGINVSGWAEDYSNIQTQVADIEDRIGVTKQKVYSFTAANPTVKPMVEELITAGATDREIAEILGIN